MCFFVVVLTLILIGMVSSYLRGTHGVCGCVISVFVGGVGRCVDVGVTGVLPQVLMVLLLVVVLLSIWYNWCLCC